MSETKNGITHVDAMVALASMSDDGGVSLNKAAVQAIREERDTLRKSKAILKEILERWDNYEESGPDPMDDLMERARSLLGETGDATVGNFLARNKGVDVPEEVKQALKAATEAFEPEDEESEKKLFEFRAMLDFALVVAADSREKAEREISTYETTWWKKGELLDVAQVDLVDVRDPKSSDLDDEAHVVVEGRAQ